MRRGWRVVRGALAALLGTLGVLAATLSIPATWVHTLVHDTDAYVGTLAPLANAPAVQEALTRGEPARARAGGGARDRSARGGAGAPSPWSQAGRS